MYEKLNQRVKGKVYVHECNINLGTQLQFVRIDKDNNFYHALYPSINLIEVKVDIVSVEFGRHENVYFVVFEDQKYGKIVNQHAIDLYCLDQSYLLSKTGINISCSEVKIITDIDYSCTICKSFYKLNQIVPDFTCYGCKMS